MSLIADRGRPRDQCHSLVCREWRDLPSADIAPLLDAEIAAWRSALAWDVATAWAPIEPARASGRLPGAVVYDGSGRARGWTCFLNHRGVLQVAALAADSSAATSTLVSYIAASAEAAATDTHVVCVREGAPRLRPELARAGFKVATYRYLHRTLAEPQPAAPRPAELVEPVESRVARAWRRDDVDRAAELCARAYAGTADIRAFAPRASVDEWLDYVTTLVGGYGCGRLVPEASFVVDGNAAAMDAAVLTTDLGLGTAHIAQVIVDPIAQGAGLGRRLLDSAIETTTRLGFQRLTLLVAATNTRACALYATSGFQERARFVVAARGSRL